jgi:hypothetical protein
MLDQAAIDRGFKFQAASIVGSHVILRGVLMRER